MRGSLSSRALGRSGAIACAMLLLAPAAAALDVKVMGGPGYLAWHSIGQGRTQRLSGWGTGISGWGALQIGEHLRLMSGMYHGELRLDDHSVVDRHLIFGGVRGVLPIYSGLYLTGGLEVGGSHLEIAESLGSDHDTVRMAFSDNWRLMLHPLATLGFRLSPKYRFELMMGMPFEHRDDGWDRSLTVMLGIFFWMGDRQREEARGSL